MELVSLAAIVRLVALGLNRLTGFAGQISLGHAGFFGIGAYATGLLTQRVGVPFLLSLLLAGCLATLLGAVAALPALRLKHLYLAIATLGLGVVVQKPLFEWRSLTGGGGGLELQPASIRPYLLASGTRLHHLVVAPAPLRTCRAVNLPPGRPPRPLPIF